MSTHAYARRLDAIRDLVGAATVVKTPEDRGDRAVCVLMTTEAYGKVLDLCDTKLRLSRILRERRE